MKFPAIDANSLSDMAATLTRPRLSKYLHASKNNLQQALRLYVFNTKISAAVMTELHIMNLSFTLICLVLTRIFSMPAVYCALPRPM
jgi:hypothetical protein